LQEHEEYCAHLQAERECEKQIIEEQLQLLKVHLHNLTNIEHTKYAPIKEAVSKYREFKK
jgi:DNA-binding protein H-NS